ncbi:MAG: alpha/beta fold hydrolase [Phototrophicaceae bacterium]
MRIAKLLLPLLLLALALPAAAQDDTGVFREAECPFELVEGSLAVNCGYVTVPEFHAQPDGRTIELAVAIIPSSAANPAPDPLVMAQGGPGGSTLEFFGPTMAEPNGLGLFFVGERDIVLIEQRGTLHSLPNLVCEEGFDLLIETIDQMLTLDEIIELSNQADLACRDRLLEEGVNLSAFNSLENAADVPMVMDALGYETFNYYGVSYGTMLAQHVMRDYPERLRSVILDAVVPLEENYVPAVSDRADRIFERVFETCEAQERCNLNFPDLESRFLELVNELNDVPAIVPLEDPETGIVYDAVVNGDSVVSLLFNAMYVTPLIPNIPRYIDEMSNDDFTWVETWGPALVFDRTTASGMYNSVTCAESLNYTIDDVVVEGRYPEVTRAASVAALRLLDLCDEWAVDTLDGFVNEAVVSDIPTLIFSGEFDPITPASGGDVVARSLSTRHVYTFPGVGHGALLGGLCPVEVMADFLSDPASEPDSGCVDGMRLAFTVSVTGPGGLFTLPEPDGWTDTSTADFLRYEDPDTGSVLYAMASKTSDVQEAISDALNVIDPDFALPSLVTQEIDLLSLVWEQNVYLDFNTGQLIIALGAERDGVVATLIVYTDEAALMTISPLFDLLLTGITIASPN